MKKGEIYERKVVAALAKRWPDVRPGVWFSFTDGNGPGICQTDAFLVLPHEVVVFEVKLTACRYGHEQLAGLYCPILSHLYKRPARGVQIAKNLQPETPGPVLSDLDAFLSSSLPLALVHAPSVDFL